MKLIILILSIFLSFNCGNTDPLDVEIYTLENGSMMQLQKILPMLMVIMVLVGALES